MKKTLKIDSYSYPLVCGLLAEKPTMLSQAMHNAAFKAKELPFVYHAFDTTKTKEAIEAAKLLGFRGLSLTIPHKEAALECLDQISTEAKKIGAVNTLIFEDGGVVGDNTDWIGVTEAFKEVGAVVRDKRALIFGAGGASRAVIYALQQMDCCDLSISNRNLARAEQIANAHGIEVVDFALLTDELISSFDLFVNTTPIGSKLAEGVSYPFSLNSFHRAQIVFDVVTNPTELTVNAKEIGATVIEGSRMLLYQALEQFRLFTLQEPPKEVMEAALRQQLAS